MTGVTQDASSITVNLPKLPNPDQQIQENWGMRSSPAHPKTRCHQHFVLAVVAQAAKMAAKAVVVEQIHRRVACLRNKVNCFSESFYVMK